MQALRLRTAAPYGRDEQLALGLRVPWVLICSVRTSPNAWNGCDSRNNSNSKCTGSCSRNSRSAASFVTLRRK